MNLPRPDQYVPDAAGRDPALAEQFDRTAGEGVRRYLQDLLAGLAEVHRGGASGRHVNELHADAIDRLIRRLVQIAEARYYAAGGDLGNRLSVVAVGGYGRREMALRSDVDLLFLHRDELTPLAANVAERIQYWLWDAGVTVGGAVRNVRETLDLAASDPSVATGLLSARFLAGDPEPLHQLNAAVRRELLADPAAFVDGQVASLRKRHADFGESLYLLQPNLKEGAGGLRDAHTAWWIATATHPQVRTLDDLLHVGLLSEQEMRTYQAALDFLWRIRNELHLLLGRKADQMSFEHQERIAADLGYEDDGNTLPVERFMGEYYRHARALGTLSEVVIEQCVARTRPPGPAPVARTVEDGFRVVGDHLEIPHASHLREAPVRLLRAFRVAQVHEVGLSRTARRLIGENLDLCGEALQTDPEAAEIFLAILGSDYRVMRTLVEMNESGLLGAFLPEWEHIVCRWQHVMYHTYTVDVHSIFLVEELRRLWRGKHEETQPELTRLIRTATDRPAIFLGCLLHDIGKGLGGDHSNEGAARAQRCLERLGLDPERIGRIVFLVRQHLVMSHVAQRRDLSDPRVVIEFARLVGDRENLRNLYLVTFADIRASSRAAWTPWKGNLLREVYERTAEFLESGRDDPDVALELIESRVEARRRGARHELEQLGVPSEAIESYFDGMPRRYFIAHTPPQIARHAQVVLALGPDRQMATAVREMRGGFSEFIVCTRDVHGLYSKVAGSLTAADINILGSHVYTTRSGLALEIYRVSTPPGGPEERELAWADHGRILGQVLADEKPLETFLHPRRRIGGRRAASIAPARVDITNDESDFYTIVDVTADDRLGLLYQLTAAIADHGYEIYVSKASTILDQVADTFYLKDADRRKIEDPAKLEALQRDLLRVARGEDA